MFVGGFRNAYDLAFNRDGELFTFDSDMEWDIGLPWYRPTRVNHLIPGAEFGWRSGWSTWPDYFVDSLPATIDIGRGSPTGVEFYDHTRFPAAACAASTAPVVSASVSHASGWKPNKFSAPAVRSAVYSLKDSPLSTPSFTAAGA